MTFEWVYGAQGIFEQARAVRREVFVEEQGYDIVGEFDEQDADSWHIVGYDAGQPVCTARLFSETADTWHVGRVAVLAAMRGKGAGLQMMQEVDDKARALGAKQLVLHSQADKHEFYIRAGYQLTGEKSLDQGQPHVGMVRQLV